MCLTDGKITATLLNRRSVSTLVAIATFGVSVFSASRNAFRLPDQDAFATARREAFVATANNPSVIYYNPAGITQLEGDQLRAGFYRIYLDPTYRPPSGAGNAGKTYHIKDRNAEIPQFFYTHTFNDLPVSAGLGVYAPFGLSSHWPEDTGFRAVATEASVKYIRINPPLSYPQISGPSTAKPSAVDLPCTSTVHGSPMRWHG
jgi:long-chain fatty acid transport protein